ncbi:armadillo repeat-containing protein 10 [Discoglossus pictus]
MGTRGGVVATRALIGLALGAGLCYCLYLMIFPKEKKKQQQPPEEKKERKLSLLDKVSGMAVVPKVQSKSQVDSENVPKSAGNLDPHHIENLLQLLVTSTDSMREQILVTLCNSAAFSVNQDIIRNLDGISLIGETISDTNPKIKVTGLNALNNLSMNIKNQEQIKKYICDICEGVRSSPLNSEVQLAGLRLLTNMSVTNNYHTMMADYIPCFIGLLVEGNKVTQTHALKVLVNLSANPSMTKCLLSTKTPRPLTSLFDSCVNSDILVRALTFAANLSENSGSQQYNDGQYGGQDSLFSLLFGDSDQLQKNLAALLQHPDIEVKEQVARLLINPHRVTKH